MEGGGEIVNNNAFGRHTSMVMGSGYRPYNDKAALMCDLQIAVNPHDFHPVSSLAVGVTNSTYYSIEKFINKSFSYRDLHMGKQFTLD